HARLFASRATAGPGWTMRARKETARRMTTPAFSSREGHGPLSGVTVLDLSGSVAGPYGCTLLGDLGAVVIKIEPPEGDNLRNYPSTLTQESRAFLDANLNTSHI